MQRYKKIMKYLYIYIYIIYSVKQNMCNQYYKRLKS